MSEYTLVRTGKLLLKGEKNKPKKRKRKKEQKHEGPKDDPDSRSHGNWWKVKTINEIIGPVAIEIGPQTYVKALDNGLFTLGAPHNEGDGPSPEEILTGIAVDSRKVAFKSGYNKYLRVDKNGSVSGRSDAIGAMEQWEPVFENDKTALQGYNDCFLSVKNSDDSIICQNRRAGESEFLNIRSQTIKNTNPSKDMPSEEQGSLDQIEINYIKKFQKFQDKRLRVCPEDKKDLKLAKSNGVFHETLLDRRSKVKADRYCK